jgi:3-(3-hydroxy-phenyl)propionate hydroxylase
MGTSRAQGTTDYDVIVCGLGPVGQLLSLLLGDSGVRTLAIDREDEPYALPRAAAVDDELLRILQWVGLDRDVLADSRVEHGAVFVTAAGRQVEVFRARSSGVGHPPLVSINQPGMERVMLAALGHRATVEVRRGVSLEAIEHMPGTVETFLRPSGGRGERVSARWLVGCDGASSDVRELLGIGYPGRTAPQRWIVVDGLVDRPVRRVPEPTLVGDPRRPTVTSPMSPGRHRWEWMLHPGEDAAPHLQPDAVRQAIGPWLDGEEVEIERAVTYAFHSRMATAWRRGRVLLAGDAVHVMPPFTGQGFSSGGRDAANLAWKLADVLAGAPERLLDSYEQERRPHVIAMQRLSEALARMVQETRPAHVRRRDALLQALDGRQAQQLLLEHAKPLPTYAAGAFADRPARVAGWRTVGAMFPQTDRLDDRLPRGWTAVSIDERCQAALEAAGLTVTDPGADAAWLRRHGLRWALLRPDRFVFACGGLDAVRAGVAAWREIGPGSGRSNGWAEPLVRAVGPGRPRAQAHGVGNASDEAKPPEGEQQAMTQVEQDRRAGPKVGSRTAFTFIANVLPGHEQTLRDLLEGDQDNPDGVKAIQEIGTLHEFRWVLLDDDRRLLFASAFDGSWEKYIQDFAATRIGALIDRNLQHVEGWIGIQHPRVAEWLLEHAVPAAQYNSAYPAPSVRQVWKALAVTEAFEQVLDDPAAAEALQHPALKPLLEQAAD